MDTTSLALQLFHRGAEADLYTSHISSWKVVVKKRIPKAYRNTVLDSSIRRERTITESSLIHESRLAGVKCPSLFAVDLENTSIVMTYIDGSLARDSIDEMGRRKLVDIFTKLGEEIGLMHRGGIVHGDLTTSNLIISQDVPFVVDFGMAHRSVQVEDRAVDLHLMQRSIITSHGSNPTLCTSSFFKGYCKTIGNNMGAKVVAKAAEIGRRGRYFSIR